MTLPESAGAEPIAVVGMACQVPGATDVAAFWHNLAHGIESRTELTRAQMLAAGATADELDDPHHVPVAFLLDGIEDFDADLFGMTAREADLADPQHRVFLELCHTALEDAGYDPARYPGDIGVYGGRGPEAYRWEHVLRNRAIAAVSDVTTVGNGNNPDSITTLASFRLDVRGPSVGVYTACSTSLVAVHLAAEALRAGECDMALAGGVCIELWARRGYLHREGGVSSADGRCRPFDARATGTVWGSGGGVVLLKRLSDAVGDRDHVRAVLRGNAINNDGAAKLGYAAPSVDGQAAVITSALTVAGVDPGTVAYVEAHGTGTALGDPIEVAALTNAFHWGNGASATQWCALGSVKSNIGHLSQAAGVVGMIKAVLALEHQLIPPSLGYAEPNPAIDFAASPFYVNATPARWVAGAGPRRAGVSSFGIGGTNAHVVLEEATPATLVRPTRWPAHLVQVSARTEGALKTAVRHLADHLDRRRDLDLADVAWTLRAGRAAHPHRAAVVAADAAAAVDALRQPRRWHRDVAGPPPPVVLLLSGQGAQYAGMGAQLYATEPAFAAEVDRCATLLSADLGGDIRPLMFATGPDADGRLAGTGLAQPALFTIGYALARLWHAWGVPPAAMIGHSVGEYLAATLAGVFDLADALRLVACRGRLMAAMPPGSMLAVPLAEADLAGRLPAGLDLAAVNGPRACVVAGPSEAVERFTAALAAEGVTARRLRTSHAFHSAMMAPVLDEFAALVAGVPRRAPARPYLSNLTGEPVTAAQATDPGYWAAHLRQPVRFGACVARALADLGPATRFLECGPGRQLAGLARMQVPRTAALPLTSLPGADERRTDVETLAAAAGSLWSAGVPLDAEQFGEPGHRVPLPTYPFERSRHWITPDPPSADPAPAESAGADGTAGAGGTGPAPVAEWFTVPTWRRLPPIQRNGWIGPCLVFADGAFGDALVCALRAAGAAVTEVRPADRYEPPATNAARVRSGEPDDYRALLADLVAAGAAPAQVVHAWTLGDGTPPADPLAAAGRGMFSLLYLVQALAAAGRAGNARVDVLTAGTQCVLGDDLVEPIDAMVTGVLRAAPYDVPGIRFRQVDLDADIRGRAGAAMRAAADAAVAELAVDADPARPHESDLVALRRDMRWRPEYERIRLPAPAGPVAGLRQGGVYLVTGGLGGLGLTIAEDLARRAGARVALMSRAGAGGDDRAIGAIQRIRAAGGEALPVVADVTDPADLRRVRAQIMEAFGRLDGIVHAAGVAGGGLTETRSRTDMLPVLAPKVTGTLALADVFGDLNLDLVVLFSSVVGAIGGLGEVDYCAANAFLDAYAQSPHGWRSTVRSLAWAGWYGAGMLADLGLIDTAPPVDHPLLEPAGTATGDVHTYRGTLRADLHWVLDGHRVSGVPLLPGTAQIDLTRAAFAAAVPPPAGPVAVELTDVLFTAPLSVPDGDEVDIAVTVRPAADRWEIVISRAGTGHEYTRAVARWVVAPPAPPLELADIRSRAASRSDLRAESTMDADGAVRFGPHWDTVRGLWLDGDGERAAQLARLELAEELCSDLDRWVLHPALLDQATSRYGRYGRHSDGFLPMAYGRILIRDRLPRRLWVHSPERADASGPAGAAPDPAAGPDALYSDDFVIVDDAGRELVRIEEFMMRRVNHATVLGATAPAAAPAAATAPAGAWIAPADGTRAFHIAIATDPGPYVIISPHPIERLRANARAAADRALGARTPVPADPPEETASDLQTRLAHLWSAVLGVPDLAVDDDFFQVGGDSLVAVQLIAQVRRATGVNLPMRSLFQAPTVSGMAAHITELRASTPEPPTPTATAPDAARPDSSDGSAGPAGTPPGQTIPRLARPAGHLTQ